MRARRISSDPKAAEGKRCRRLPLARLISALQLAVETGFTLRRIGRDRALLRISGACALPRRLRLLRALRLPLHHHAQPAALVEDRLLQASASAPVFSGPTRTAQIDGVVGDDRSPASVAALDLSCWTDRARAFEADWAPQIGSGRYRGLGCWFVPPERMPQEGKETLFLRRFRLAARCSIGFMDGTRLGLVHAGVRRG